MAEIILACPILSLMKAQPCPCRGSLCAWWVKGTDGDDAGCAIKLMAEFFEQRRYNPDRK